MSPLTGFLSFAWLPILVKLVSLEYLVLLQLVNGLRHYVQDKGYMHGVYLQESPLHGPIVCVPRAVKNLKDGSEQNSIFSSHKDGVRGMGPLSE